MFDYEPRDEIRSLTAEEKFKSDFFDTLVDAAISSVTTRFEQIRKWFKLFGFLCNAESMRSLYRESTLRAHCKEFELKMGNIHAEELEMELNGFVCVVEQDKDLRYAKDFLDYIYKHELNEIYPNMAIGLRVLLTTPVTVASAERSFSRMKIIKNVLRSTMNNDRLSALGMISIENETARSLDYEDLVNRFAEKKVRIKPFV